MNVNKVLKNVIDGEFNENALIKALQYILRENNIIVSLSVVKNDFKMLIHYIKESFYNHEINNINDLMFYVVDELDVEISNNEYLFNKYFNNEYHEITNNFEFVEVI